MPLSDYAPLHAATLARDAVLAFDSFVYGEPQRPQDFGDADLPFPRDRTCGFTPAGEPDRIAAFCASYAFARTPVPGGELAAAGLTWVGVDPGHRRRGLLSAMIAEHMRRCRARGEALSILFAAEAPIYGRFGYGSAADAVSLTIPRGARLRDVPGQDRCRVRFAPASRVRHGALVARLHREAARPGPGLPVRPGWILDEPEALDAWNWIDGPAFAEGAEHPRAIGVVERDGRPCGYALFRRQAKWQGDLPAGTVRVREAAALDPAAARALWGALTDLDLMASTAVERLATDDVLLALLANPRAARPQLADNLWVRLVDMPRALAARQYQADVDMVLDVADAQVPGNAGRWRLRAPAFDAARVERTAAEPDLSVDQAALAAAYLGGRSLASLAAAGLVREQTAGALARCSAAFGWPVAPVCPRIF